MTDKDRVEYLTKQRDLLLNLTHDWEDIDSDYGRGWRDCLKLLIEHNERLLDIYKVGL